jgi:hypothetical protein
MNDDAGAQVWPRPGSARFFRRQEDKYEIGLAQAMFLREEIGRRLPLFSYQAGHSHTFITTVYFDTRTHDFFHKAERNYDENVKIRVKEYFYGLDQAASHAAPRRNGKAPHYQLSAHCYVEIKEKVRGTVIKRRFCFPKKHLARLFRGEDVWPLLLAITPPDELGPLHEIYSEFKRFISAYPVEASSVVNYRRTVYQEVEDHLRITFDDQIGVYPPPTGLYAVHEALTPEVLGKPLRATDAVILEIKCAGEYPAWLRKALQDHTSKRLSKFTTSVRLLLDDTGHLPPVAGRRTGKAGTPGDTELSSEAFY